MSHAYEQTFDVHHRSVPSDAPISSRVDHHFDLLGLPTTDCHGMIQHVLDCLGSLRVQSKLDHRMTPAIRSLFRSTCLKFLEAIVDEEDENHDDGSAIRLLMNVFPDTMKRKDGRGWLPLHWAASIDDIDENHMKAIAKERPIWSKMGHAHLQIGSGSDFTYENKKKVLFQSKSSGMLPFHFITSLKHPRLINIKTILSLYPEAVKIPDANGWLPLHWSAWNCMDSETLRFLLELYNAAIYSQTGRGQLPLLLSMHNKRIDIIDDLLESNPDALEACDWQGNTAIHYAVEFNNPQAALKIIQMHPQLATMKNFKEEVPVHRLFEHYVSKEDRRESWRQLELLRIILDENPETVSQKDIDGNLPLHLAVHYNANFAIIEQIYNVYPSAALIRDNNGKLPIEYCDQNNKDVINLLLSGARQVRNLGITSSFADMTNIIESASKSKYDISDKGQEARQKL